MTRDERIALNKSLDLSVEWLEALTDDEYEADRDFQEEKALKLRAEYRRFQGKPNYER